MKQLLSRVNINVNKSIYLKDPNSSALGERILANAIDLILEKGFEDFTFKQLAKRIESSEASIYRYFENKNKLLLYLTAWYWGWIEYKLVFATANIQSAHERLNIAIKILTEIIDGDQYNTTFDLNKIYDIIITESSKSYLIKSVDEINKDGVYLGYMNCVQRVSEIVTEINPEFPYPRMLISTVVEGAHHQRYFADHLPRLTDVSPNCDSIEDFYASMVFKTIGAQTPQPIPQLTK